MDEEQPMNLAAFLMPTPDVMAFSKELGGWLKAKYAAENPRGLDTGGGLGGRDIWVKRGGAEYYIQIRPSIGTYISN